VSSTSTISYTVTGHSSALVIHFIKGTMEQDLLLILSIVCSYDSIKLCYDYIAIKCLVKGHSSALVILYTLLKELRNEIYF
jgi:hypothetical protein